MDETKPRIPPLPREQWTNDAREVFAFWGEPDSWFNGSRTNIVNTLATHPQLAMAYNIFGKHLLVTTTLAMRPREIVIMRIAWLTRNDYEWHYHVGYTQQLGMSLEEVAAIKQGADAPNWNDEDRAVLRAVDELSSTHRLSDETWAALSRHFDQRQRMDLIYTIGHYFMVSWALNVFGVELEENVDKIDYDLKTASGKTPGVTYRPGEVDDWYDKNGMG